MRIRIKWKNNSHVEDGIQGIPYSMSYNAGLKTLYGIGYTQIGNLHEAERRLKLVEDLEALVKAIMISGAELEDLRRQETTRRFINKHKHGSRKLTAIAPPYELAPQNIADANS